MFNMENYQLALESANAEIKAYETKINFDLFLDTEDLKGAMESSLKNGLQYIKICVKEFFTKLKLAIRNFFMKIFDVYLKAAPVDELSKMLENINQSGYMNDNILSYLELGFAFLFIFIMVILIIYNVFTMFCFFKEQILIFLFDVKYELLSSGNQENINKSDEGQTENT